MRTIEKFTAFYRDLASMQVSALKEIYSPSIVFIDPVAEHKGLNALETYFSGLLENAKHCEFRIKQTDSVNDNSFYVTWTMTFTNPKLNKGRPTHVDGLTNIQIRDDLIWYHRDYFDLGQMVYENVPVLGWFTKKIKNGMS